MVTRSQRRIERKQVVLIVILIMAVASVSFALGVMFGQRDSSSSGLSGKVEKPRLPVVTKVTPPPPLPVEVAVEKPEQLTFYDNLPKGNQAPLGSGINHPPEQEKTVVAVKPKEQVAPPVALPVEPSPKKVAVPVASTDGAFVVQVASFRTSDEAKKFAERLADYKLTAYLESVNLGAQGVWHRVLVGPYVSRESAEQTVSLLKNKEKLSALVRQR